jgi:hypothetical protein
MTRIDALHIAAMQGLRSDVGATHASPLPKHAATLNLKELGYGG